MKKYFFHLIIALTFSQPAFSQEKILWGEESLGLIHNTSLEVIDNISGGCWTNAEAIKQKTRLTLEQSGIGVYLEPLADYYPKAASIFILAYGERSTGGTCYGSIEMSITDTAARHIGDYHLLGDITYFDEKSVAIGPSLNGAFSNFAEEATNKLAATILSNRRNEDVKFLLDEYKEELESTPETDKELRIRLGLPPRNN